MISGFYVLQVLSLLGKIEPLCSFPIQGYVHSTLDRHYAAIFATQTRRREECVNSAGHQKQGSAQGIEATRVDQQAMR